MRPRLPPHPAILALLGLLLVAVTPGQALAADPVDLTGTTWDLTGDLKSRFGSEGKAKLPAVFTLAFGPQAPVGLLANEFTIWLDDGKRNLIVPGTWVQTGKRIKLFVDLDSYSDQLNAFLLCDFVPLRIIKGAGVCQRLEGFAMKTPEAELKCVNDSRVRPIAPPRAVFELKAPKIKVKAKSKNGQDTLQIKFLGLTQVGLLVLPNGVPVDVYKSKLRLKATGVPVAPLSAPPAIRSCDIRPPFVCDCSIP